MTIIVNYKPKKICTNISPNKKMQMTVTPRTIIFLKIIRRTKANSPILLFSVFTFSYIRFDNEPVIASNALKLKAIKFSVTEDILKYY